MEDIDDLQQAIGPLILVEKGICISGILMVFHMVLSSNSVMLDSCDML